MDNFNSIATNTDKWFTPKWIIDALGKFDLDPCFLKDDERPWDTADNHYYAEIDGLKQVWNGRVWLNPPYDKAKTWFERMAQHNNGIGLIFARTDTKWFHDYVFNKASGLLFWRGRIKFVAGNGQATSTAPAASVLISYNKDNLNSLYKLKNFGNIVTL